MEDGIFRLADRPAYRGQAAQWFHEKWGIPREAYLEGMEACLRGEAPVPSGIWLSGGGGLSAAWA